MGTPRPTIQVENLSVNERSWPGGPNWDYDNGVRFAFRIGKLDEGWWGWPWPEWIGLPTRREFTEWMRLINGWKFLLSNKEDIAMLDEAIVRAIKNL